MRWLLVLVASVFALDAHAQPRFVPLGGNSGMTGRLTVNYRKPRV